MANIIRRITVKQEGDNVEQVAFLSDVTLNGITGSGLVTVIGDKDKVVSTDPDKLIVGDQGDVKVVTPLELASNTTPSVPANKLYNKDGQLYWGDKVVGVVDPGEVPVSQEAFDAHKGNSDTDVKHLNDAELGQIKVTDGKPLATKEWASGQFANIVDFNTLSDDVDTIKTNYVSSVTGDATGVVQVAFTTATGATGKEVTTAVTVTNAVQNEITKELSGTGLVTGAQAQAAINKTVESGVEDAIGKYNETVIGAWTPESTITGTVKTAIEANAAKIAALEGNHFEVVDKLPGVSEGKFNVIYLVPTKGDPTSKDEFILIEEGGERKWEQIGTTKVDLSNYFTKDETNSAISTAVGDLSSTADTDTAADTDGFVTVGLTGTVGDHGLSVTTSGIAKASEVGNVADLTTTAKDTVVAAVNEVADKASTAVQTVSSGDSANIKIDQTDTEVTVTPNGTLANLLAYCTIAEVVI